MNTVCYLHENGELIFKPADDDTIAGIQESDLCKAMWILYSSQRALAWQVLVESLAIGAKNEQVLALADSWRCDNKDAEQYAKKILCRLEPPVIGLWTASRMNYEVEGSPVGTGLDALVAMANLAQKLGFVGGKTGEHASFEDLLRMELTW